MPRNDNERPGVARWIQRSWRALVSELVSTALLVLLGVATLVTKLEIPLTHPALGFGFVIIILVVAFGPASGAHMNPAVTLAALIYGTIGWGLAIAYVVAQVLGGIAGFGLLLVLTGEKSASAGCTAPGTVGPAAAAAVEALLTGSLVLLLCGLWAAHDDARPDHTAPLKAGLGIAGLVYAGGPMTGASLNPARSFGPALLKGYWVHHWVYWVGPLAGAALAALLHRFVLRPPPVAAPAPRDETLPLQDKV